MTASELLVVAKQNAAGVTMRYLDRTFGDDWQEPMAHLIQLGLVRLGFQHYRPHFEARERWWGRHAH